MYDVSAPAQDPALKHWPFKEGIIPVPFARRKQLLYENKCLRDEVERLTVIVDAQKLVVGSQSSDIKALNEKLNTLMNECIKAQHLTQDIIRSRDEIISTKDNDIAKLQRDNRSYQEALHRTWNDHLIGGDRR